MNVRVAFKKLDWVTKEQMRNGKIKPGYTFCGTNMIFYINMDITFTRKARLVADGHKTEAPALITYSSVVSRDSVRINLTVASMNGHDIFACDIGNSYFNATCRGGNMESCWSRVWKLQRKCHNHIQSLEWAEELKCIMERKLADMLRDIGYFPSQSNSDVWLKKDMNPDEYHYWIICSYMYKMFCT